MGRSQNFRTGITTRYHNTSPKFTNEKNVKPQKIEKDKSHSREKILPKTYLREDCYQNTQRTLKTQHEENNPIKKWAEDFNRPLIKEDIRMDIKHTKRCSTQNVIRKM